MDDQEIPALTPEEANHDPEMPEPEIGEQDREGDPDDYKGAGDHPQEENA